ncbi:MAG TPA: RNA polymerase sigma factor [Acidimicrobiia bacterium]
MDMDYPFDEVLAGAKAGDEWSWQVIYQSLSGNLVGYLAMRGAREPEDQASETLLQVARNIHTFEGDEDSFRSWVFVIAHRRLIDARRRHGRRPVTAELDEVDKEAAGDAEEEAIDRLSTEEVTAMLDLLTDEQKEVIVLRTLADMSLEQTARVMGKRVGSVKALQRRGIARLRKHFDTLGVSR